MRSAWVLVVSSAWSCGDGEDFKLDVSAPEPGTGGSSADAGAGGAPEEPVFTGGSAVQTELAPAGGSRAAAEPVSGGNADKPEGPVLAGGTTNAGQHSPPGVPCLVPADCDDGLYCNGDEVCEPWIRGSDVKVCKASLRGPCYPSECDEEEDQCDCSNPDSDGDTYLVRGCTDSLYDCDDRDDTRSPGLSEYCSLEDPWHDEDCREKTYGARDEDGDLFYDYRCANIAFHQSVVPSSEAGDGGSPAFSVAYEVYSGNDCNDDLGNVNPNATEVCDGRDNDCDGLTDEVFGETSIEPTRYFRDFDSDRFGATSELLLSLCPNPPPGYVRDSGDCDDADLSIAPDKPERCNGIDDDCDGTVDEPFTPGAPLLDEPFEDGMTFECGGADGWLVTSCPPGRLECVNPSYRDACETIGTTLCNCHECGATCNFSCGEASCEEITDIGMGVSHTCAIARPNGDPSEPGSVACWGWNRYGQLGNGTSQDSSVPVPVEELPRATAVAVGDSHSCAIAGGTVYCWGWNDHRQLGSGSLEVGSIPVAINPPYEGATAKRLTAGSLHSCAIYDDGRLGCWGDGSYGQLGNELSGEGTVSEEPGRVVRRVDGELQNVENAVQVAAGTYHTCALLDSGTVECWGSNDAGQIGQSTELSFASRAMVVPGLEGLNIDEIAAAAMSTCVRAGTEVWCWGSNYLGELAREDVELSPSPVRIPLSGAARGIAVGNFMACARLVDGSVHCWGANWYGERGTDEETPPLLPTAISVNAASGVFAGAGSHVCVTQVSGAWCWGRNEAGQLGTGAVAGEKTATARRVQPLRGSSTCVSP